MEEVASNRKWLNVILVMIVFAVFAASAWYYFSLYDEFNQENLRDFIGGFGPWAPLAYAAIYIISSPVPFLAPVISAVGGFLFGALGGVVLVLIVATLSSLVPFTLSRRLGREWAESKLKGKRLEEIYAQSEGGKGFTFIILMRLIPVVPWEMQNYVAGLTKISVLAYLAGTLVGIIPGSSSLVLLGAAATDPTSWEFFAALAFKIVVALIPVVALAIRARRKALKRKQATESE